MNQIIQNFQLRTPPPPLFNPIPTYTVILEASQVHSDKVFCHGDGEGKQWDGGKEKEREK